MAKSGRESVVVTAAGGGIGRAIAERFHGSGALVHICDICETALEQTLEANPGMRGAVSDVGDPASVEQFFDGVLDSGPRLDVLVNNAGIGGPRAPVEEIEYADWDSTIRVNLSGMFYCVKKAVPAMKRRRTGSIINISTGSTRTGLPLRAPYVASKAGVEGFTKNLARELGPSNIRCNAILPGLIDNPRGRGLVENMAEERDLTFEEAEKTFTRYISMRTWIDPAEVADMAFFLASDAARHISGQLIGVCGNVEWEE